MSQENFPDIKWLLKRRAWEQLLSLAIPVLRIVSGIMGTLLLLALLVPLPMAGLWGIPISVIVTWIAAAGFLTFRFLRRPSGKELAKRADKVLGFQDDLLALSEFPSDGTASEWQTATWAQTKSSLASRKHSWPLKFTKWHGAHLLAAGLLTIAVAWKAWDAETLAARAKGEAEQAKAERIEAAEEVIKDWEEFVKTTDDPELKKLFSEAVGLREAVKESDPMAAMLAMNQIEAKMSAVQNMIAEGSIAPQAARMAEALEAFEGMGAMSATLRNQNFQAASAEAEKLGSKLEKDPSGASNLRRGGAVAEMLAKESATAQKKGNSQLGEALSKLSDAASENAAKGSVPNQQISPNLKTLKDQFSKESLCKNSGRLVSTGKNQLDSLRKKLRGESGDAPPSLCNGNQGNQGTKPGGLKAGRGTDGTPLGDPTQLAEAGLTDKVAATAGEGESETITTSANSGTAAAAGASTETRLAEYIELSQKAVADESLPLAHRRAIRTYFERIRPVAESTKP